MFDFLSNKFSTIFSRITGQHRLTEKNIDETFDKVKEALLEADVSYQLVETFIESIKTEVIGQKVLSSLKPAEQLIKVVHEKLLAFLGGSSVSFSFQLPSVVMVMGLQGSGKTTSIAKMAHWVHKQAQKKGKNRSILAASVDFNRPAAIDQLEILAGQVNASFYRSSCSDPIQAAEDIYNHYRQGQFDLLFLDTAGRLHIDNQMLQELRAIDARIKPKYKILVLDAMTGQESLNVAQAFEQNVGFHSALLSKMDSDTRGGAAFSFRYALKKPIIFVGSGERVDDIELFHPDRMAGRILGMGDVQSLIEKADEKIKKAEQEAAYKSFMHGKMTLQDFADQLAMVSKMGSMSQLMKYVPGMSGMNISPQMIEKGEVELKKFKAMINSMTPKERFYPHILKAYRKQRIALGAGVSVSDVNILLQRFEQSQQYAKLFKKTNRFQKFFS